MQQKELETAFCGLGIWLPWNHHCFRFSKACSIYRFRKLYTGGVSAYYNCWTELMFSPRISRGSLHSITSSIALTEVSENGYRVVVKLLIERDDVEIDSKSKLDGHTPLLWVVMRRHEVIVKLMQS